MYDYPLICTSVRGYIDLCAHVPIGHASLTAIVSLIHFSCLAIPFFYALGILPMKNNKFIGYWFPVVYGKL